MEEKSQISQKKNSNGKSHTIYDGNGVYLKEKAPEHFDVLEISCTDKSSPLSNPQTSLYHRLSLLQQILKDNTPITCKGIALIVSPQQILKDHSHYTQRVALIM